MDAPSPRERATEQDQWLVHQGAVVHPDYPFHGLGKAAAARLAEAGCRPHKIMAPPGHATHQQAAACRGRSDRAGSAIHFGGSQPENCPAERSGPENSRQIIGLSVHF